MEEAVQGKHRRVSISDHSTGIDNPGFDHRRISVDSAEPGGPRRKSILHNGSHPGSSENIHKFSDLEHHFNSGPPRASLAHHHVFARNKSSHSLSSSIRCKVEYTEELER